ncbi:hypothetical protein DV736_g2994, partial [Chaetothyriales sp. CBS 134916]
MSDDDDFMQDSDAEQYDFEYEDDDEPEGGDVDIENKYYNAKQLKADSPEEAIEEFLGVQAMEEEKGDWGFKGLKQAIKLEFALGRYDDAVKHYIELLTYVKSVVTRNYSEKSINNMLDYIEKTASDNTAFKCMEEFYSLTLDTFRQNNNERLALKTNLKLAKLFLDKKDYKQLSAKVREIHQACQKGDGTDDPAKGTYSLEAYALEIQMYAEMKNNKRLKAIYQKALTVRSAVPHPKVQGVIRECGGKMHMSEENWKDAQSDFFESFKNYDEAGSMQRIQVLKYLVLTTMLMKSTINPFDSQETKPYRNDPRISAMTDLVGAYQTNDIHRYSSILSDNQDLLADPFIAENIDEVSRNMRTQAVSKLIAPYTRFTLPFVARQIKIPVSEVQDILGVLIVEKKLKAKINQENGTVIVNGADSIDHVQRLRDWTSAIEGLFTTVLNDGEAYRVDDSQAPSEEELVVEELEGPKGSPFSKVKVAVTEPMIERDGEDLADSMSRQPSRTKRDAVIHLSLHLPRIDSHHSQQAATMVVPNPDEMEEFQKLSDQYQPDLRASATRALLPLTNLVTEYAQADPTYVAKTQALARTCEAYRRIIGDGQCTVFGYFEILLRSADHGLVIQEQIRIRSYNEMMKSVGLEVELLEIMFEHTFELFETIRHAIESGNLADSVILNALNDTNVSDSIVYHFKASCLERDRGEFTNQDTQTMTSAYMAANPDSFQPFLEMPLHEYRQLRIDPTNQEIDQIGLQALTTGVIAPGGIAVEVLYLDRSAGDQVTPHNFAPHIAALATVRLLYRPGHYDLIYQSGPIYRPRPTIVHAVSGIHTNWISTTQDDINHCTGLIFPNLYYVPDDEYYGHHDSNPPSTPSFLPQPQYSSPGYTPNAYPQPSSYPREDVRSHAFVPQPPPAQPQYPATSLPPPPLISPDPAIGIRGHSLSSGPTSPAGEPQIRFTQYMVNTDRRRHESIPLDPSTSASFAQNRNYYRNSNFEPECWSPDDEYNTSNNSFGSSNSR